MEADGDRLAKLAVAGGKMIRAETPKTRHRGAERGGALRRRLEMRNPGRRRGAGDIEERGAAISFARVGTLMWGSNAPDTLTLPTRHAKSRR